MGFNQIHKNIRRLATANIQLWIIAFSLLVISIKVMKSMTMLFVSFLLIGLVIVIEGSIVRFFKRGQKNAGLTHFFIGILLIILTLPKLLI